MYTFNQQQQNCSIVEYEEQKYLGMCWDGSIVNEVKDLPNVIDIPVPGEWDLMEYVIEAAVIAAVYKLETTFKCLRCGSRTERGIISQMLCRVLNSTKF